MDASQRGVVANGRVLGPLDDDENFLIEDFSLLERFTSSSYLEKINVALENSSEDEEGILFTHPLHSLSCFPFFQNSAAMHC